jgi:hypothetical protein
MTMHVSPASLEVAAGVTPAPSLLRRFIDAWMESRRRNVAHGIAEYPRCKHRADREFRLELEQRLLGQ